MTAAVLIALMIAAGVVVWQRLGPSSPLWIGGPKTVETAGHRLHPEGVVLPRAGGGDPMSAPVLVSPGIAVDDIDEDDQVPADMLPHSRPSDTSVAEQPESR